MTASQPMPDDSREPADRRQGSGKNTAPLDIYVEAVPKPFLILNPDFTIAKANSSFLEKFGLNPEDTHGSPLFKLGGCWENPMLRKILEETIHKDSFFDDFELEHEVPGGSPITLRVSGRPIPPIDGPAPKIVLHMEDITEQKMLQRDFQASELRYRRLFETAEDGILILDFESGKIQDANPYLARILGVSRQELQGKELWELGFFENAESSKRAFRKLQAERHLRFEDLPLRTLDGRNIEVEFICTAYQVDSRDCIQCNIRDVSERKRAEAAYFQNEQKLRQSQKMEALGRLAGGIAHDFNNLLTAINGYTELCMAMPESTGAMHDSLQEILRGGERAAALTRQILAFSRQQMLAPKAIRLNDIVGDMKKMLERILGDHIRIVLHLDPDLGVIKVDPGQMEQVILNLAVNARDAMPSGGILTLETRMVEAGNQAPVEALKNAGGRFAMLAVRDTGIGMDSALVARIFDPFYTTKGVSADPKGRTGTGLGLSVVHGIVTQSGGSIHVESQPGRGTTFRIFFPMMEAGAVDPQKPVKDIDTRGGETVLLVEDEEMVRTYCRKLLESQGYTVLDARDGEGALSLAEGFEGSIQLLLTDIMMPGINGWTLAKRFLLMYPDCPILFMSGYTSDTLSPDGLPQNRSRFIQKPFTSEALMEAVRNCLESSLAMG